jgi:hypothetical protein
LLHDALYHVAHDAARRPLLDGKESGESPKPKEINFCCRVYDLFVLTTKQTKTKGMPSSKPGLTFWFLESPYGHFKLSSPWEEGPRLFCVLVFSSVNRGRKWKMHTEG